MEDTRKAYTVLEEETSGKQLPGILKKRQQ
jgi:hypothetical protein